ncbi:hypothetical protein ACFR9U_11305 [Halorientalis brevis]|uniref:Uncharacterized protein n=1 Tax=Halorientalis brevis TaxID=1126241 RepID=A0ABD6CC23_9EURY|nr:hypothetical protein [Halorientalis brevis]
MSRSDNTAQRGTADGRRVLFPSLSRYDLLLAFMPTVFLISLVVGNLLSIGFRTALSVAGIAGIAALIDALFLNPPKTGTGRA